MSYQSWSFFQWLCNNQLYSVKSIPKRTEMVFKNTERKSDLFLCKTLKMWKRFHCSLTFCHHNVVPDVSLHQLFFTFVLLYWRNKDILVKLLLFLLWFSKQRRVYATLTCTRTNQTGIKTLAEWQQQSPACASSCFRRMPVCVCKNCCWPRSAGDQLQTHLWLLFFEQCCWCPMKKHQTLLESAAWKERKL